MQLGIIGLGRMGGNIARRLMRNGHDCVVYDARPEAVQDLERDGASGAADLGDFVRRLQVPRAVWVMLPAGAITEQTIVQLGAIMQSGDIVIDGGNSFYRDDIRRAHALKQRGIGYVDVGTSGGVWGLERGYCMMLGGTPEDIRHLSPIFDALAPGPGEIVRTPGRAAGGTAERGYLHCGPVGAGHFVKMIHNGIEYGLMEAYAEGFDILHQADSDSRAENERYKIDLADVAEVWRRGSVIGSWLLDLTAIAFTEDGDLKNYSGYVDDSGEGRWTLMAAIESGVPVDVLSAALYARFRSRDSARFGNKILSAMRKQFGGHVEPKSGS
ncbi:MAG TPA: decarboxylating 6-phosphogluconate dehydrogenase [Micropepsaceae bacterium]|jgi:6-phosphogluconate dehydrogenase|nr:decarboxylating 6-phosphogluconate dehydrogenase [Micropepsaceae bacterium]